MKFDVAKRWFDVQLTLSNDYTIASKEVCTLCMPKLLRFMEYMKLWQLVAHILNSVFVYIFPLWSWTHDAVSAFYLVLFCFHAIATMKTSERQIVMFDFCLPENIVHSALEITFSISCSSFSVQCAYMWIEYPVIELVASHGLCSLENIYLLIINRPVWPVHSHWITSVCVLFSSNSN